MEPNKIVGAGDREERTDADFYPTPSECTLAVLQFCLEWGIFPDPEEEEVAIWECACGEGHISDILEASGYRVISTDIRDTGYGKVANFLHCTVKFSDILMTNPPFYMAEKFIHHAMKLGIGTVVLLMKSTYFHAGERLELFRKYRPSYVLPMAWRPNFNEELGKSSLMDFSWYIWTEEGVETIYDVLEKPELEEG